MGPSGWSSFNGAEYEAAFQTRSDSLNTNASRNDARASELACEVSILHIDARHSKRSVVDPTGRDDGSLAPNICWAVSAHRASTFSPRNRSSYRRWISRSVRAGGVSAL